MKRRTAAARPTTMRNRFALAMLLISVLCTPHAFAAPLQGTHLSVELVARDTALVPGQPTQIGLLWKMEPGWHIYWTNAGDSGEPPTAKWNLPPGMTAGDLQFPAPKRLPLGPLMDFGYEDQILMPVPLSVANGVKAGTDAHISADLKWLVCREVCLPGKGTVTLTLPVEANAVPGAHAALFKTAQDQMAKPLPAGDSVSAGETKGQFVIELTTGKQEKSAQFFPSEQMQISNPAEQPVAALPNGLLIALQKDENLTHSPAELSGILELSGGRNYLVSVPIHAGLAALPDFSRAETLAAASQSGGVTQAVAAGSNPPDTTTIRLSFGGTIRVALLAFLGGIILNLMPCVFPVLFLKGLSLVQLHGQLRRKTITHGALYTLGILVSFWAIAGVLLALRSGGAALGWGFQFQSPTFVALITLLLFFFGLSLAGQFEFGLTLTSAGGRLAAEEGAAGSFFTGVLATIVATPCTAPFMGAAIGFALAQSAGVSLLIFTSIALGLAAPYVALTLAPGWTRFLPKPGAWMEILKQAAAVPIFATVIWLVWLYAHLAGMDRILALMAALLLTAIAGWALGRWPARPASSLVAIVLLAGAVAVPVYAQRMAATQATWQPWSQSAVDQARAAGKPVFVDFTAAWCLSCQFNERTVLRSKAVEQAMDNAHVVRLRADWTQYDPAITAALNTLGRQGVPTYVVYPGNTAGQPDVLPEALTQSAVIEALQKSGGK